MKIYYPIDIKDIIKPVEAKVSNNDTPLSIVLTDSRKLTEGVKTLFFAIQTKRNNGAKYISELYDKGVRNFVVSEMLDEDIEAKHNHREKLYIYFVVVVVVI